MRTVGGLLGEALGVVVQGLKLAGAHLPILLVIYFLGAAGRNGILWAGVELSDGHPTLAGFLLPFAPLSTLVAFILMLRVVAPSLSTASFGTAAHEEADSESRSRTSRDLTLLASTLVPFLTVYAAQGYLREDFDLFINRAVYDELFGKADVFYGQQRDVFERISFATGWFLVMVVIVAFGLRFLLSRFKLPSRHFAFGGVAAYVEVLWLLLLAAQFTKYQNRMWDWIMERRFVHGVQDTWARIIDALGAVGTPVQTVATQVGSFIDSSDDILLIPIAWLTVGAVALGGSLTVPPRERRERPWHRHLERAPKPVRSWTTEVSSSLTGRFRGLADGFRLLALGGLLPMLLFCLVFVLSTQAGQVVDQVWRMVVGPQEHGTGLAFSAWREVLSTAVQTTVLIGLLAAAIDRIMSRSTAQPSSSASSEETGISA